jgi:hypothetical protein
LPHAPQFAASVVRSTHRPSHARVPLGQTHAPAAQLVPPVQARPHCPQLEESLDRSTQLIPQGVAGRVHVATHAPCWQNGAVEGQAKPQRPQLAGSRSSERQTPSHDTAPVGHAQLPPEQPCPAPHAIPHAPQLPGSVAVSGQLSPHRS